MPYLTAGYPDWNTFDAAVRALAAAGADVLELGIPFSDPLADGPTIQRSSHAALEAGVTVDRILHEVETRSSEWGLPLVFMSYVNPILAYGVDAFCARAQAAGVSGLLLSDLPPEELPDLWQAAASHGLDSVLLVAPTTRDERIGLLAQAAKGFVYCVSRMGVTGQGGPYAANLRAQVETVRRHTQLPVVVGFGIRSPEDAAKIAPVADGVVIGARLIEIVSESGDPAGELGAFLGSIRSALAGA
ncbi:MAG: tryptophan synthase subunit alpha [Candidatus Eisenbacteria bacterium]|uniref:Tryptophan synthase alpha chain n=1 Tax=Eiseniibacteriota bacterium TaxID=2212470 RepID=A0A956RPN2_UNCEI|nr:tryptophan synthase subunit alpha [Candidatus Eisenbacteria bacterium]